MEKYLEDCFIFWKCPWEDINELHNLLQNLHPKIKFTMEHSSKELLFLDIIIKTINGQIFTVIYHKLTGTQQYIYFNSHHPKNCIKFIPYTLAHWIYIIITNKIPSKELQNPKKHNNEKPLAYITTYNKNNPEPFTEMMKNLELKNNDKIKEILDTTKVRDSPKILKEYSPLLHSGISQHNTRT